ncbi:TetR family transcriptional regulator [Pedobacter sp. LMG 31464]|uniref:TetR family transcriptional regulator n=1 Tax=Pedobacter planticolens TaxID=2679964 RepID=A0A923E0K3_9SPHI|nr:TetR/AcrR family transcriptional regulator [Pedobacter planticolens]MBB2146198.1 TetR family transcriptional regulator [Pedobacter planticolens]
MEKTDKKTEILRAAEMLFSEFGFEGTSTRQIAKESGANMAMINYYFGSKEGVFLEIMEARISGHKSTLKEISELQVSPVDKLMKVIDQYTKKIFSNVCFHRMMQRELSLGQRPEIYSKIKDAIRENRLVIEEIFADGVKDGSFRAVDGRMLIATIFGAITSVSSQPDKVIDDPKFDIENDKQREELRQRLSAFLQHLVQSYIIIPNK